MCVAVRSSTMGRGCFDVRVLAAACIGTLACASAGDQKSPDAGGLGAVDASASARDATSPVWPADASSPGTPDAAGTTGFCGDGFIDLALGEVCDDQNTSGGDGCAGDCRSVECNFSDSVVDPATHHCFWRDTDVVSRSEAIAQCAGKGGFLVRWASAAERDLVYGPTVDDVGGKVWLGLQKLGSVWTWDDGTPAGAELVWRSGEPSGDGTCAEWGESNALNDVPCSVDRDFVCERPPAGTPR